MPCLITIVAFFLPRLTIACLAIFSTFITRPFTGLLFPILGFIFLPYTLLAYCYAKYAHGPVEGWYLVLVILAVLMDLGVFGHGAHARRRAQQS